MIFFSPSAGQLTNRFIGGSHLRFHLNKKKTKKKNKQTIKKNRFIGGSETTSFGAKDFTFSLWAVSNDTTIEREVENSIYR